MQFQRINRMDGRIELGCEHGVGHTVYNPNNWGKYTMSHGCDGCCLTEEFKQAEEKLMREHNG